MALARGVHGAPYNRITPSDATTVGCAVRTTDYWSQLHNQKVFFPRTTFCEKKTRWFVYKDNF